MFNRREFIRLLTGGAATGIIVATPLAVLARTMKAPMSGAGVHSGTQSRFKAVAFDAFTIFDPRPIFALVEQLYPGKGTEFGRVWRNKQFDYAWLHLMSQHYVDFWKATEDALVYAAKMVKVELTKQHRDLLLKACLSLKCWPDAPGALAELKKMGLKLAFLSNFTPMMLESNIKSAGLEGVFDKVVSTDTARTYKPEPRAYKMAMDELGLKRDEILFAPFAGWDSAGAKSFGYATVWVNRIDLPPDEMGVMPDAVGTTLADVVKFVKG